MNRRYISILFLITAFLFITGCGKGFSENGIYSDSKSLVRQAKMDIIEVNYDELKQKLENKEIRLLIDVREATEYDEGFINQSDEETDEFPYPETFTLNVPRGLLEFQFPNKKYWDDDLMVEMPEKDEEIIIYSFSGGRSALATKTLQDLGYNNVKSYKGGYRKWQDPTLPDIVEEAVDDGG